MHRDERPANRVLDPRQPAEGFRDADGDCPAAVRKVTGTDAARSGAVDANRRLLARRELSLGRPDLSARQSAAERAAEAREHIKPRLLGHWGTTPGLNFIYAHLNRVIKRVRPRHDLHHRSRPRRSGRGRQHVPGRHLQRGLSRHLAGRSRDEAALQAVLVSRRHSQPRRAGDAGLDPRRRRARLLAVARLRRGVRQSGSDRRLRRRRWRSGDRTARDELALEQVPESGARRRGAADPASERLQDRRTRRCSRAFRATSSTQLLRGLRLRRRTSSKATIRRRCIS